MKDDVLYNMRDNTEYEANLFAADLILDDKEIADLSKNEDLNYLQNIIPDETALMFIPVQTICFALTAGKQKRI